ncbi:hypothetical protein PIB30_089321 [Stylosanthes scabra]|uniref:Uncharacterized protein n=1 Tax=Stylosanthes scabra TaxID=79078 RepID=A0ABU6QUI7_9FABA|nr:hypothetical protein [Stylosanthes scabra]
MTKENSLSGKVMYQEKWKKREGGLEDNTRGGSEESFRVRRLVTPSFWVESLECLAVRWRDKENGRRQGKLEKNRRRDGKENTDDATQRRETREERYDGDRQETGCKDRRRRWR